MKTCSMPVTAWSYLVLLLPGLVSSAPSSASVNPRTWRPRKAMNTQAKRQWSNETYTSTSWSNGTYTPTSPSSQSCAAPGSQAIDAPYTNVWGGLTGEETASIAAWLFSQPQFNLTVTEEAGDWDNSLYVPTTSVMHIN